MTTGRRRARGRAGSDRARDPAADGVASPREDPATIIAARHRVAQVETLEKFAAARPGAPRKTRSEINAMEGAILDMTDVMRVALEGALERDAVLSDRAIAAAETDQDRYKIHVAGIGALAAIARMLGQLDKLIDRCAAKIGELHARSGGDARIEFEDRLARLVAAVEEGEVS